MNRKPKRTDRGSWKLIGCLKAKFLAAFNPKTLPPVPFGLNLCSAAAYCVNTPLLVSKFVAQTVLPFAQTSV